MKSNFPSFPKEIVSHIISECETPRGVDYLVQTKDGRRIWCPSSKLKGVWDKVTEYHHSRRGAVEVSPESYGRVGGIRTQKPRKSSDVISSEDEDEGSLKDFISNDSKKESGSESYTEGDDSDYKQADEEEEMDKPRKTSKKKEESSGGKKKGDPVKKIKSESPRADFHKGDYPKKIISHSKNPKTSEVVFLLDWRTRGSGVKPRNSEMGFSELKLIAPTLLKEYYQQEKAKIEEIN